MKTARESHPKGFKFIFFGELAERAAYYGAAGLLAKYLTDVLGFTQDVAGPLRHIWTATCYILPLLGGYMADRWFGKFRTIIYWSLPYICGQLILSNWQSKTGLAIALVLLAIGSGVIKPNISPLMGMMYDLEGKSKALRAKAFSWFYSSINIGAASTMLTLPLVRDHVGYQVAFFIPAILMAFALGMFFFGRKHYPKEEMKKREKETTEQKMEKRMVLKNLSGIFMIIVFFWSIFDQGGSTWVYFAQDYLNLHGLAPDMLQGINPVLVVGLTPLFAFGWDRLSKKGHSFTFIQKMLVGFILVIFCMGIMTIAGIITSKTDKVTVVWEMAAYVIITMAEICISVVGLEMAYDQAPERLKSTVTAAFLFTVFIGNLLAGVMSSIYPHIAPSLYFGALTLLMCGVAMAFYKVGRRYEQRKANAAIIKQS